VISSVLAASFRDPAGFVWQEGGVLYRHVDDSHKQHHNAFLESGLYENLADDGLIVRHEEVTNVSSPRPGAYKVLKPEVVDFISYPYEWCFGQLKDAALLTLEIQRRALDHAMSLRDASAYNIQFHHGRPVLIDTLSFEVLPEGRPWVAYRQFCQHFLAPLALMTHCDVRLSSLLGVYIDGVPLDLASRLLPRRTRLSPGLLAHVHAQGRLESRRKRDAPDVSKRTLSLQGLRAIVWNLERTIRKLEWEPGKSVWSDYYAEADHYSDRAFEHKKELVGKFLDQTRGSVVWDLGGNIGVFAREATARGKSAVCFDVDLACVEANYRRIVADEETQLLPLVGDLTNPTPAIGWANKERASLQERGPADVIMALAVVHHLAIANNVPLEMIAQFFGGIGRSAIVEFVPKDDQMVQLLLANRDDIFPRYTQEGFEQALESVFAIRQRESIDGSKRVLYLLDRKAPW
jgi:hypothetical protein